jgi:uncharacterized DUF497 family protein
MKITFDPDKDAINRDKHGVSLAEAARLDWNGMQVVPDLRYAYGEDRYKGIAALGNRLYAVIYTPRDDVKRIISLRKASQKEFDEYEHEN